MSGLVQGKNCCLLTRDMLWGSTCSPSPRRAQELRLPRLSARCPGPCQEHWGPTASQGSGVKLPFLIGNRCVFNKIGVYSGHWTSFCPGREGQDIQQGPCRGAHPSTCPFSKGWVRPPWQWELQELSEMAAEGCVGSQPRWDLGMGLENSRYSKRSLECLERKSGECTP